MDLHISRCWPGELAHRVAEAMDFNEEILCYIRHPATVKLLSRFLNVDLQPSSALYKWREGDDVWIVTLRRPVRGMEVEELSINDLLFLRVRVRKAYKPGEK